MTCQRGGIAEDDQFHPGSGDGHIHTAQIAQETYLTIVIGTHQRYQYNVALLSLKAVNGIHTDQLAERLGPILLLDLTTEILHLHPVR